MQSFVQKRNNCTKRGCKESNSGEHTWKATKDEETEGVLEFKVPWN